MLVTIVTTPSAMLCARLDHASQSELLRTDNRWTTAAWCQRPVPQGFDVFHASCYSRHLLEGTFNSLLISTHSSDCSKEFEVHAFWIKRWPNSCLWPGYHAWWSVFWCCATLSWKMSLFILGKVERSGFIVSVLLTPIQNGRWMKLHSIHLGQYHTLRLLLLLWVSRTSAEFDHQAIACLMIAKETANMHTPNTSTESLTLHDCEASPITPITSQPLAHAVT